VTYVWWAHKKILEEKLKRTEDLVDIRVDIKELQWRCLNGKKN